MAKGLTKSEIIEIQTAAEFNYHKHRRMAEDHKNLQKLTAERIEEAAKPKAAKPVKEAAPKAKKS